MPDRSPAHLIAATPVVARHGTLPDSPISQVGQDSRTVAPGGCFVAVPGFRVDGHHFLAEAVDAGARCLIVQTDRRAQWEPLLARPELSIVEVEDTRAALADLAAAYHGYPARSLTVIGVTGTDGKSTTCYLTSAILEAAGYRSGMIGGVQFKIADEWRMNTITQTSPEAPLVQALLAEMVEAGVSHAVIECTSHGFVLQRLAHCEIDVAVFTGFSDDHLDFHGTTEAYLAAKLRLFQSLDSSMQKSAAKRGIVNADDPQAAAFRAATRAPVLRVGLDAADLDVSAGEISERADGTRFRLITEAGALSVDFALPARFNLRNALAAAGAARALEIGPVAIARALGAFRGVPGRMEQIEEGQPFSVVVDAAATTAALQEVLRSIRPHVSGRLIVVFGCAGERDPERRSGMGRAAAEYADYSVLTSENPRTEDPAAIVREIAGAMEAAGRTAGRDFEEEPDRRAAIGRGLTLAKPGDYVLIAGKGAEQTLIFGDSVQPWDDRAAAREILRQTGA